MTITAEQAAKLLVTGSANYCGNDLARALITSEAVKTLAAAKPGGLFTDQDEDICIDDGRANNLVFCPARDDSEIEGGWPVLNPDVVAEIVARYNIAPDLARALIAAEAARKLAEERLAKAVKALGACIASLERADTSEGVCCCGDDMKTHSDPMSCGHSPVDMGDYYAQSALEAAHAILKEIVNG